MAALFGEPASTGAAFSLQPKEKSQLHPVLPCRYSRKTLWVGGRGGNVYSVALALPEALAPPRRLGPLWELFAFAVRGQDGS